MTETNPTPEDFKNPETFRAMLAKVGEPEQAEEEAAEPEPEETEEQEGEASEPEPQEEPEPEPGGEQEASEPEGRMVPKGRFNEVIQERNQYRDETRKERDERIRVETELANLKKAVEEYIKPKQQAEEDDAEPIDEATHKLAKKVEQDVDDLKKEKQQEDAKKAFSAELMRDQQEFASEHPDFDDAWQHIQRARIEQEKALLDDGKMSEAQLLAAATQAAHGHLLGVAVEAKKRGRNAAEVIYKQAKALGFTGKKAEAKTGPDLDAIARNQKKSSGISKVPGTAAAPAVGLGANSTDDLIRRLRKNDTGSVPMDEFRKLLKRI